MSLVWQCLQTAACYRITLSNLKKFLPIYWGKSTDIWFIYVLSIFYFIPHLSREDVLIPRKLGTRQYFSALHSTIFTLGCHLTISTFFTYIIMCQQSRSVFIVICLIVCMKKFDIKISFDIKTRPPPPPPGDLGPCGLPLLWLCFESEPR